MTLAALFTHPMLLSPNAQLWLILPLFVSVAVVHKAMRVDKLRQLPLQIVVIWVYMVLGTAVLGILLWGLTAWLGRA
jgi:hypothetical protein